MSATIPCVPCCATQQIVDVPGSPGLPGADGAAGVNAFTTLLTTLVIPGAAGPVVPNPTVVDASWIALQQTIFASDGTQWGTFTVTGIAGNVLTLTYLDAPGDTPGMTIAIGGDVSPAGTPGALAAALPAAIADAALTGVGAVGNLNPQVGTGMVELTFEHTWIGGTAPVQPVTQYVMPFKFRIVSWSWVTEVALTGGGAGSRVANLDINGTSVGTVPSTVTVTQAGASTIGTVVAATAVAGANTGAVGDRLSVLIANGGTALTGGSGTFHIVVQNMDTADTVEHLITAINALITALT